MTCFESHVLELQSQKSTQALVRVNGPHLLKPSYLLLDPASDELPVV